jgi:hypothetical protein
MDVNVDAVAEECGMAMREAANSLWDDDVQAPFHLHSNVCL